MGMHAAEDIAGRRTYAGKKPAEIATLPAPDFPAVDLSSVRPIVSRHLGIVRQAEGLTGAIRDLLPLTERNGPESDPALVALAIAVFAALRTESRGAHFRDDFPEKDATTTRRRLSLSDVLAIAHEFSSSSHSSASLARSA